MLIAKKIQGVVTGLFLSAALFLSGTGTVDAMEIRQYDKMSPNDRARYDTQLYVGAVEYLWAQKRDEDAEKVREFFKKNPEEVHAKGTIMYTGIINKLRQLENRGQLDRPPHAEDAMMILLERIRVKISKNDMMQFAKDFQPKDEGIAKDRAPSKPSASLPGADDLKLAKN